MGGLLKMKKSFENQATEEDFEPSAEWTDRERKTIVCEIAEEMTQAMGNKEDIDGDRIADWSDRLSIVASKSPEFLEANRKHVLKGQWKPKKRK